MMDIVFCQSLILDPGGQLQYVVANLIIEFMLLGKGFMCLEAISKPHLAPDGCVEGLFKMLTYSRVCCVLSSALALPSNAI